MHNKIPCLWIHRLKAKAAKRAANKVLKKAKRDGQGRQAVRKRLQKKLSDLEKSLAEFLGGSRLEFVMSQLRSATRKAKGQRWTYKDKSLCLALLHSSPKTYRLLRKVFAMPSIQTLKKAMQNIKVYPGFNESILKALQLKTASLPPIGKLVAITMDEMAIKTALTYDKGRDLVEGFSEGLQRTKTIGNHALAFMVRGLTEKWKQAVGYFISSGPMSGGEMRELLMLCIHKLRAIGLTVTVVIGDQGSNNQNLFGTHLGVTVQKPFFHYENSKVFCLYDPPHLLKNVRNNLKNRGFTVGGKDVLWEHITKFYDKDSSKPIRMAPRLTRKHLDLPPFSQLSVRLAAQVLSHSVAAGMAVMAQWNILPVDVAHTAEFVDRMDKLFNTFNSRSLTSKAQMNHGYRNTSGHKEFLLESLTWLDTVKSKGKRQPACFNGWKMAIHCLMQLYDDLSSGHQLQYILTNRLNQDCVENFFSTIRAKGAQRDNPDAGQFRAAFAQVMVDGVMMPTSNSNCAEDVDKFLLTLGCMEKKAVVPLPEPPTSHQVLIQQLPGNVQSALHTISFPPEVEEAFSKAEVNILTYIGGYIVRKIRSSVCETCLSKIVTCIDNDNENHDFVNMKKYVGAKDGLKVPSEALLQVVTDIEAEYRKVIDDVIYSDKVKATLLATLIKRVSFDKLACTQCHVELLVLHLMINIRLHHTLTQANRDLAASKKDRKNRKILKFSHL